MKSRSTPELPSPELGALILAAAAGDRVAATELLTRVLPRVRNLVRYLVRGDSEVDDIAQRVLIELLGSFRTYRAVGSFEAWCDRITVRVTLGHRRASRRFWSRTAEAAQELYAVRSEPALPDEYWIRRQLVQRLDGVPSEQREALVLHHVLGLSVRELATDLRIPFETARSRLRLGSARMRALITQGEEPS